MANGQQCTFGFGVGDSRQWHDVDQSRRSGWSRIKDTVAVFGDHGVLDDRFGEELVTDCLDVSGLKVALKEERSDGRDLQRRGQAKIGCVGEDFFGQSVGEAVAGEDIDLPDISSGAG